MVFEMRVSWWPAILCAAALYADTPCACEPSKPETLKARECSLCGEAEKHPSHPAVFFVKDNNPRKPNRTLALPREHAPANHKLVDLPEPVRRELWKAAIEKAKSLWGDEWGVAYNGIRVRTQCHAHIHLGKLLPGVEMDDFKVVNSAEEIPSPPDDGGIWVHPVDGKLHVHTGEQITETVLLR